MKTCRQCGGKILSDTREVFCSTECKETYWRREKRRQWREKSDKVPIDRCLFCDKIISNKKQCSKKYCNERCRRLYLKHGRRYGGKHASYIDKNGFYIRQKEKFKEKIIDYKDSPTGKAYIGINKTPLMPNEDGYGFQGVLIQDDSRQFIQCCGCGEWRKKITAQHLKKCSDLTTKEYKEKFGLYPETGLVSDETSRNLAEVAIKNKNKSRIGGFTDGHKRNIDKKTSKLMQNRRKEVFKTRQWQNSFGSCPEQLKARMKEFLVTKHQFPAAYNKGQGLYKATIKRFGSWNKAMDFMGLPRRKRQGTNMKFTFPDYTVYAYNINRNPDRKMLYNLIVQKCDLFKNITPQNNE